MTGMAVNRSFMAPVVLVGAGDIADCSASGDEATAALLDNISGTVFTAGDNAYPDGSATNFSQCYDPSWGRHKARTRPSPGNHDYHISGAAGYFGYFGSLAGPSNTGYYSYDLGEWHIISLNSNISMSVGSAQEQWLRADLAASTKQCTIAYWHHPRFSSGLQHGSSTSSQPLWQALYESGAEILISGHEHNYERFAPQDPTGVADATTGIREFVVGTGGASHYTTFSPIPNSEVRNGTTWGVLKLTLDAGTYSWQFIPIAGQTFTDAGSGTCHGPPGSGVSPSQSTIAASPATIVAGGAPSTITVTARDALGNPISGATVLLAATGSGNTLTQPAAPTNTSGVATGSLASMVAETKIVSATINDTAITQTTPVTVTQPGSGQTISHLLLTAGNNSVNQKVYATAVIAPVPNTLVTVAVLSHRSTAAITPTLSGGGMSSWTQVASVDFDLVSSSKRRLTIFRAMSPSPTSGPITITYTSSVSNVQWIVSQWTGVETSGVNGSGAIVQSGSSRSDGSTGLAVALNAFTRANNVAYGVVGMSGSGSAVTPGTGFAEIAEQPSGESSALETEWTTGDNTIDAGWASAFKAALLGVEIQAAAGGGPAVSASLSTATAVSPITAGGSSTITVTARNGSGNPVSGVAVTLSATGNNTITQPAALTDVNGVTSGSLSATVMGSNTVTAVAGGVTLNPQPVVTVNPGAASGLAFTTQPSNTAANAPITPAVLVEIRDQYGNRVNSLDDVVMAIGTNPASGTLSGTLGQEAAGGVATFSDLTINNAGAGYTLVASLSGVPNVTSSTFNITPPTPSASLSTVSANPTSFTAGGGSPITVTVKDGQGNVMSGVTVTLSSTVSGDVITQPASATDGTGVTTGTVSATSAGVRTITAVAGGITLNQQPSLTVAAGPPHAGTSTVSANPTSITAGSGSSTITVTVRDQYGNSVNGSTVALFASGTGNTVAGGGPTNASGVATGTLSSTVAEIKTVSATAGGMWHHADADCDGDAASAGITHALLTSGSNAVNQNTSTTASIAPAANRLITVAVLNHRTPAANSPTLSGGGMTSWNVVSTVDFDTIGGALRRLTIFRAMSASPGKRPHHHHVYRQRLQRSMDCVAVGRRRDERRERGGRHRPDRIEPHQRRQRSDRHPGRVWKRQQRRLRGVWREQERGRHHSWCGLHEDRRATLRRKHSGRFAGGMGRQPQFDQCDLEQLAGWRAGHRNQGEDRSLERQLLLRSRQSFGVAVLHAPCRKAVFRLQPTDAPRQCLRVRARCRPTAGIGLPVAISQLGIVLLQDREKPVPDPGIQAQWARGNETGSGPARRREQGIQAGQGIGDPGQDRCDDQSGIDPRRCQSFQRAQANGRHRGACLDAANQRGVQRHERDMDFQIVAALDLDEHVDVARDERALGDDADRQSFTLRQSLEHGPRDPKAPLGRLVRIGGGADHDGPRLPVAGGAAEIATQIALQRADDPLLDEDPLFERFPPVRPAILGQVLVRQLPGIVRTLDDVAMRVARIAVRAPEFAPDVRIERPEIHSGLLGGVEHGLRLQRHELGAAQSLVQHGRPLGRSMRHAREREQHRFAQPHRDHPHCGQVRQLDCRSIGARQSGHSVDCGAEAEGTMGMVTGPPSG